MCATCGCSDESEHPDHNVLHGHEHSHDAPDDHSHHHRLAVVHDSKEASVTLRLQHSLLARNDTLAERNRRWFAAHGIVALNLMSSPGAGKTTILERMIRDLGSRLPISVIEGDLATSRDADRLRTLGARVVQINTGTGCHLDAAMVFGSLPSLNCPEGSLLMIENVGNLVCPALFDLGEKARVVIASTPEGDDKPLKYPQMFRAASVVVLNKLDLVPYLSFNVERFVGFARQVNPELIIFQLSATQGTGLESFYSWMAGLRSGV